MSSFDPIAARQTNVRQAKAKRAWTAPLVIEGRVEDTEKSRYPFETAFVTNGPS